MRNKIDAAFVFGGCVSRDSLGLSADIITQVDYFARSSFASIFAAPCIEDDVLAGIDHSFSRRLVSDDMSKRAARELYERKYDLYLIDFISQYSSLKKMPDGGIITLSSDYLSVRPNVSPEDVISVNDPEHQELWLSGFSSFLAAVSEKGSLWSVRILETYWADRSTTTPYEGEFAEEIFTQNNFLRHLYTLARDFLPESCFIKIPRELIVADPMHKWGTSPFHYIPGFYSFVENQLFAPNKEDKKYVD